MMTNEQKELKAKENLVRARIIKWSFVCLAFGLFIGIASTLAYGYYNYKPEILVPVSEKTTEEIWCSQNKEECLWAKDRQEKLYDAAKKLYFSEEKQ